MTCAHVCRLRDSMVHDHSLMHRVFKKIWCRKLSILSELLHTVIFPNNVIFPDKTELLSSCVKFQLQMSVQEA